MATSTTLGVSSLGTSVVVNPAATTTPSVSVFTLTVKPLTTPFKPPASCGEMHLTRLSSPGNQIWLNEPQPVPGSKFSDCYPSDFIAGYTSVYNASSSIVPMFSPLVCPEGWVALTTWTKGYMACCASGFQLHLPDTVVDSNRPAYGGTCYSNFQAGQTVKVTAYDTASVTATATWIASATDQAYAHPIDGFQVVADDNSPSSPSSPSSSLSGGTIAGIVVGSIVGLIAILLAIIFLVQQYRRKKTAQASSDVSGRFPPRQGNQPAHWDKELPISPSTGYLQSQHDSTGGTFGSRSHSHRTPQRYELGVPEPHELDSGWKGRELDGQYIPKHEGG
nr:C121A protein [Hypoxylon sp. CO27-5]